MSDGKNPLDGKIPLTAANFGEEETAPGEGLTPEQRKNLKDYADFLKGGEQCEKCRHYNGDGTCVAFPDSIPREIMAGKHDHTEPFEGDHGIHFEPIIKKDKLWYDVVQDHADGYTFDADDEEIEPTPPDVLEMLGCEPEDLWEDDDSEPTEGAEIK